MFIWLKKKKEEEGKQKRTDRKLIHTMQENAKLTDYFDLICGTSTGGIIALGLQQGKSIAVLILNNCVHPKNNMLF